MRQKIVAGNWKMNPGYEDAKILWRDVNKLTSFNPVKVIVAPPACYLSEFANSKSTEIALAAQNCHHETKGAYTGEISAAMLVDMGITHCLVGHSERRAYFKETNRGLAQKVDACITSGVIPIYCCGEQLEERKSGTQEKIVGSQIQEGLFHLSIEDFSQVVIAYEPVWAIGTGETASPDQAQEMHAFIRDFVSRQYGTDTGEQLSILYGGSCKPGNAADLFGQKDVDGGLIGGAALQIDDFHKIIQSLG